MFKVLTARIPFDCCCTEASFAGVVLVKTVVNYTCFIIIVKSPIKDPPNNGMLCTTASCFALIAIAIFLVAPKR